MALAKKYSRDDKTANSHNYTNGIMVAQVAYEVIRRVKAKGLEINRKNLYDEMNAMNGAKAFSPDTTVGPVTYSPTDHAGGGCSAALHRQKRCVQGRGSAFPVRVHDED